MSCEPKGGFCQQLDLGAISLSSDKVCKYGFAVKEKLTGQDLIPQGMCIFAFQAVYPYYLTLSNGGWFSWVKPGEGVIVQCPNPTEAVEMKVLPKDKGSSVLIEVIQARGCCSKGHKKGDSFSLAPENFKFCPTALGAFVPYICLLAQGGTLPWQDEKKKWVVRCPDSKCGAILTLAKREP